MDSEPSAYFSLKPNLASFGLKHISKIVILEKFVLFSDVCRLEKQQMTYQVFWNTYQPNHATVLLLLTVGWFLKQLS